MKEHRSWIMAGLLVVAVLILGAAAQVTREEFEELQGEVEELREKVEGLKDEVRTRNLVIEDEKGKSRIALRMMPVPKKNEDEGEYDLHACLAMFGEGGTTDFEKQIGFQPILGQIHLLAGRNGPLLTLHDEEGTGRATLGIKEKETALALTDGEGNVRTTLGVSEEGPKLKLIDEKGTNRATLGTQRTTTPRGKKTIYPESSLFLYDSDEKVIFKAP